MWRLAFAWIRGDRVRAVSVLLSVFLAVTAFTVLTGSVQASGLQVSRTIDANYRSSYDVLVRPHGSQTALEKSSKLVRPNFLSGIYGGISQEQVRRIRAVSGVEIAAPVAMIGTVLETAFVPVDVSRFVTPSGPGAVAFRTSYVSQGGRTVVDGPAGYVYVTDGQLSPNPGATPSVIDSGMTGHQCAGLPEGTELTSPFAPEGSWSTSCWSRSQGSPSGNWSPLGAGRYVALLRVAIPVTLAAIDPTEESKLVGLGKAVTDGRYLSNADGVVSVSAQPIPGVPPSKYTTVPVLASTRPLFDETLRLSAHPLTSAQVAQVVKEPTADRQRAAIAKMWTGSGAFAGSVSSNQMVTTWRESFSVPYNATPAVPLSPLSGYWTGGPVAYRNEQQPLIPVPQRTPVDTWKGRTATGMVDTVPPEANLPGFRVLEGHVGAFSGGVTHETPALRLVGSFDPNKISSFSPLSKVPLETYQSPEARVGTGSLLPNFAPAGYLQAPPMLLTTMAALPALSNYDTFDNPRDPNKPVSVVRVRVAGVTGADAISREKVRLVADQITKATGLDVDITMGSSPAPVTVNLPVGAPGQEQTLTISEGWSRKGVVAVIRSAVDRKSLLLFVLVLVASALTVAISAGSSVDARRSEIAKLRSFGWPRSAIRKRILAELTVVGLLAGVTGALVSIPISMMLGAEVSFLRCVLAVPAAMLLCFLAGLMPAQRASRITPIEGLRPRVRSPRRPSRSLAPARLGITSLLRNPSRLILSATAVAVGVAALLVIGAIMLAFRGAVVGTLLGDAVTIQVRGQDIAAVIVIWLLSLLTVVNVAVLEIRERSEFYALLQSFGWSTSRGARVVTAQGALIGLIGGIIGVTLGLALTAALTTVNTTVMLLAAAILGLTIVTVTLAATLPTIALGRLPVAHVLSQEES